MVFGWIRALRSLRLLLFVWPFVELFAVRRVLFCIARQQTKRNSNLWRKRAPTHTHTTSCEQKETTPEWNVEHGKQSIDEHWNCCAHSGWVILNLRTIKTTNDSEHCHSFTRKTIRKASTAKHKKSRQENISSLSALSLILSFFLFYTLAIRRSCISMQKCVLSSDQTEGTVNALNALR